MQSIKLIAIILLLALAVVAQENRSEAGLQGGVLFTQDARGRDMTRHATDSGSLLLSYRYHVNRWLSMEAAYGFSRNTQEYSSSSSIFGERANLHQFTGGFVFNVPALMKGKLSPYVLAEGGGLTFSPTNSYGSVAGIPTRQTRGALTYGGGVNYPISKSLSFRAEYRGLIYSAPNFHLSSLNMKTLTHTAQPSIGIVFRF
jgi:opacity protein-like surface antigen